MHILIIPDLLGLVQVQKFYSISVTKTRLRRLYKIFYEFIIVRPCKKYPGLSSAPASIYLAAWTFYFLFLTKNHNSRPTVRGTHARFSLWSPILKTRVHIDNVYAITFIEIINNTRGGIEFKNWERS
jgi:hypothetical protein